MSNVSPALPHLNSANVRYLFRPSTALPFQPCIVFPFFPAVSNQPVHRISPRRGRLAAVLYHSPRVPGPGREGDRNTELEGGLGLEMVAARVL